MTQDKVTSSEQRRRIITQMEETFSFPAGQVAGLASPLSHLTDAHADRLPRPGHGATLERWQSLAEVAAVDLALVKLFEGHTDALAIIAELGAEHDVPADAQWGMWAAEPPFARVVIAPHDADASGQEVRISGRKAWCSGAPVLSHGLMTAWQGDRQRLVAVALDRPGVEITDQGWEAVGMAATASMEVVFDEACAWLVGPTDGYLERSGFWQGGAGIAACWFGGARRLGDYLHERATKGGDAHLLAHLGAVDVALESAAALLRDTAAWIDAHPQASAKRVALRARAGIEASVETVIHHVGRALGAGPYCRDPAFARRMADLPVFVRQSHGQRDLEALGRALLEDAPTPRWSLAP